ncbi:MAG: hypothetical protein A3H39_05820 [candidate division NC10 bacterium RIFCSPLOWO2_02_FULL_66_22]|nr:MAG: hypothetical protein A3H39_05820 [candidate division NC10 bacterium RIFCSPLOWO2_02_FULL_66_22]
MAQDPEPVEGHSRAAHHGWFDRSHHGVAFLRLPVASATQTGATHRQVGNGFVDQLPGTGIPGWGSGSVFWAKLADGRRVKVVAGP